MTPFPTCYTTMFLFSIPVDPFQLSYNLSLFFTSIHLPTFHIPHSMSSLVARSIAKPKLVILGQWRQKGCLLAPSMLVDPTPITHWQHSTTYVQCPMPVQIPSWVPINIIHCLQDGALCLPQVHSNGNWKDTTSKPRARGSNCSDFTGHPKLEISFQIAIHHCSTSTLICQDSALLIYECSKYGREFSSVVKKCETRFSFNQCHKYNKHSAQVPHSCTSSAS
jgi:hypothetical protein